MSSFIKAIGGRKMLLSILVVVVSSVLAYFSKLEQESYYTLIKYVVAIYLGGNVLQRGIVSRQVSVVTEIADSITGGLSADDMGGRKFLFVIGIYVVTVILLLTHVVAADIYVDIANWLCFTYIGTNVVQKSVEQGVTIEIKK